MPKTFAQRGLAVAILLLAILWLIYGARVRRFFAVDTCLDAGGCWDHVQQRCRHDIDHCP